MRRAISAEQSIQKRQTVLLASLAAGVYLALCLWFYFQIRLANYGHFLFALDDPYIHLSLSQQLAHGHYGINPQEYSSPSSSIVWPLLLTPFARFAWQRQVPLCLNLVAGMGVAILGAAAVARWPVFVSGAARSLTADSFTRAEQWRRILAAVALVFIGNLVGLTFIGMEHTLQVLLAGAGAWCLIACLRDRPMPLWALAAVAVGPSVRYENLGILLAVAIALVGQRQIRRAGLLLLLSLLPVMLFSLFLHHLTLPWVPTSVLVKSRVPHATGLGQQGLFLLGDNANLTFIEPQRILVLLLFITLALLAWQEGVRVRRFALAGATAAVGLQLFIGRFGWFHRYEVYAVFFGALVLLHVVHERQRGLLGWFALGLLGCSFLYLEAIHDVVLAANQVFRQQYQTRRFCDDYFDGNVAVNDIGLVSYARRPNMYVLDLWGLASAEAAEQKNRTTAWLEGIVQAHHVGLVVLYPMWFPPLPRDWTPLGELCLSDSPVVLGGTCVSYYATPAASLPELQNDWNDFVRTLPPGLTVRPVNAPAFYR